MNSFKIIKDTVFCYFTVFKTLNGSLNDLWSDGLRHEPRSQRGVIELRDRENALHRVVAVNSSWTFDAKANLSLLDITYSVLDTDGNLLVSKTLKTSTGNHLGYYVVNYIWTLSQPLDSVVRVRIDIKQQRKWCAVASVCVEATVW